jgi:formyltetrahydrofolate deformylase
MTEVPLSATLLISCSDRKGLVAAVTDFIFSHNGNILRLDQHVDAEASVFFMRVEWDLADFSLVERDVIKQAFQLIAHRYDMAWALHFSDYTPRMAIFVSKGSHCLHDILSRYQSKEWRVEIPLIISNHPTLGYLAQNFDIPFHVLPITKENKQEQEQEQLRLLAQHQVDFIVLARYMQIISSEFVAEYPNRIINIHHSFLPAFVGAKPYHQAYQRGVKIIGATSHYVTADLDAGPIIEQDVMHVSHRDSVEDLIRKGKDIEKLVLARAIRYRLNNQILVYKNKTVVFA